MAADLQRGHRLEVLAVTHGVWILVAAGQQGEHPQHVYRDRRIHSPHICQSEPAVLFGIPPSQQKVGNDPSCSVSPWATWISRSRAAVDLSGLLLFFVVLLRFGG